MSHSHQFVHLHVHSEYSMLDGLSKLSELVEKVKSLGQTAIALTDHGSMYGIPHFYNACKKAGVKPILGVEAYVARNSRFDKQTRMGSDQAHLTILAKDFQGYQNLMHLTSIANFEGFSYKPRIDEEALFSHSEGLIILSGCMNSWFNKLLRDNKDDEALALFKKYQKQYKNVELKINKNFHDRFLIIDEKEIYHLGASLKDLGNKVFAFSKLNINSFEFLEKLR